VITCGAWLGCLAVPLALAWFPLGPGPLGIFVFPFIPCSPLGQCAGAFFGGLTGVGAYGAYAVLIVSDLFVSCLSCWGGLVSVLGAVTGGVFQCCSDVINCCSVVF